MQFLPDNIKIIRLTSEKTQEQFAKLLGVSIHQQKSYERRKAKPDILYMQRLSEYSGLSSEDLMNKKITNKSIVELAKKAKNILSEPLAAYGDIDARLTKADRALIKTILHEVAKLKAFVHKRDYNECLEEIKQNTNLLLESL